MLYQPPVGIQYHPLGQYLHRFPAGLGGCPDSGRIESDLFHRINIVLVQVHQIHLPFRIVIEDYSQAVHGNVANLPVLVECNGHFSGIPVRDHINPLHVSILIYPRHGQATALHVEYGQPVVIFRLSRRLPPAANCVSMFSYLRLFM